MRGMTSVIAAALTIVLAGRPAPATAQQTPASARPAAAVVNLNTASASDFEALPGVGPKTAALIVEYRQKSGNFKKIEDHLEILESARFSGGY